MGIQRENVVLFLKAMVKHFEKKAKFQNSIKHIAATIF